MAEGRGQVVTTSNLFAVFRVHRAGHSTAMRIHVARPWQGRCTQSPCTPCCSTVFLAHPPCYLWPARCSQRHYGHPYPWRRLLCAPWGGLQSLATSMGTRNQLCTAGALPLLLFMPFGRKALWPGGPAATAGLCSELRLAIALVGLCQRSDPTPELCPVLPCPRGSGQGGGTGGVGVTCLHVAAASPGVPEAVGVTACADMAPGSLRC